MFNRQEVVQGGHLINKTKQKSNIKQNVCTCGKISGIPGCEEIGLCNKTVNENRQK